MFQKYVSYCFFLLIIASAIVPLYSPRTTDTLLHSSQRLMAAGGGILDPLNPVNGLRGAVQSGINVSDRETNLTTDKATYAPGDWVEIEVISKTSDMNGSLEWYLESPIGEVAFGFNSSYQDIFKDPTFDNTISDWIDTEWSGTAELTSGYLNLTEESDADTTSDEIFFYNVTNPTYTLSNPRYVISFDYFSRGSNLINNSGFESGPTDWNFEPGNVTFPSDPENASEGSRYAQINATEDTLILYQNITAWTGGREISFSAKATGTTDANYWKLRIEEFNSSGLLHRPITESSDSRNALTDEKGYAFLKIFSLSTHPNTTKIRASLIGMDTGSQGDGFYTGRLDECLLAEVPPALVFSYWEKNGEWRNETLPSGTHDWASIEFDVELAASAPSSSKTFRFILPDGSDVTNITTAYWGIDNIAVNLATKPAQETGISHQTDSVGEIESTWFHRGFRENLTSSFIIKAETPDETRYADSQATIQLQLPKHQIYFGSWIFVFKIHQEDDDLNPIFPIRLINLSFIIEEQMNFVTQDTYLLRGSTNQTVGNDSVFTEYFEKETAIAAISPGDNVTILGYLEANSTPTEWYDLNFLEIGIASTEIFWQSPNEERGNLTWAISGFIPYNDEGITLIEGNFSNPLNNIQTFGVNFQIPARGIYGNLTANLTISLLANNTRPGGVGSGSLVLTLPLSLPEVRFHVNVTTPVSEQFPGKSEYVLTEYLEGNISVDLLNFDDDLETDFPNRNITSKLDLPLSDLDLTIFLDDLNQTPSEIDIAQDFHYNIIGHTILWLDQVDPHLVPGFYAFKIRWNTPFQLNVSEQAFLAIRNVTLEVKGSLTVQWSVLPFQIEQGAQITINFTVLLDDSNRSIGGLNLEGIIDANVSLGRLVVYEDSGVYKIDFDIEPQSISILDVGNYSLSIRIGDRDLLPPLSFEVTAPPQPPTDGDSAIDLVFGIAGFGFFVIVAIAIVGVMFWIEKSI